MTDQHSAEVKRKRRERLSDPRLPLLRPLIKFEDHLKNQKPRQTTGQLPPKNLAFTASFSTPTPRKPFFARQLLNYPAMNSRFLGVRGGQASLLGPDFFQYQPERQESEVFQPPAVIPGMPKSNKNPPTTRVVNPWMSLYNLAAMGAGADNRFRLNYSRIGDVGRAAWWKSHPREGLTYRGRGPDIIGTVTDAIGLGVNELHYIPELRARQKEALAQGNREKAERLNRSITYARLGTLSTLSSLMPTLYNGRHNERFHLASRIIRGAFVVPAKTAVMLDGIQQDLKSGYLDERNAAAYTLSGLARLGVSWARYIRTGKGKSSLINNLGYAVDMGVAAIENMGIAYTGLTTGNAQPIDLYADTYRKYAPKSFDKPLLSIGRTVNEAMEGLGFHNENSQSRKALSYFNGDWQSHF